MQNDSSISLAGPSNQNIKDNDLWITAKRRAGFKISAFFYVAVNSVLVAIWFFSLDTNTYFWPKWPLLGWGIGIATQYFHAYHGNEIFSVQKEYEKLKTRQQD